MALRTVKAKIICHMIGFSSGSEILLMTVITGGGNGGIARGMTLNTFKRYVGAGQRKIGEIMIEGDRSPGGFVMTDHTICRECIGDMVGISNGAVISLVASETFPRQTGILVVHVTIAAHHNRMDSPQFKPAELHMIKLSAFPLILIVANVTVGGESK